MQLKTTGKRVFGLFLFGVLWGAFCKIEAEPGNISLEDWVPPYAYWLDPLSISPFLLDTAMAEMLFDTGSVCLIRSALYDLPLSKLDLDAFYRSVWKPDSVSMTRMVFFDTVFDDYIRQRMYRSYWGWTPHVPFSEVYNMFSIEHIRDTLLLRKRRGVYVRPSDLSHQIKSDLIGSTGIVKRVQKPLINPKDSVTRWAFDMAGGINMAQTSLTNWAAGGESSVSGNARLTMNLAYRKGGHKWETKLNTEYGLLYDKTNGLNKTVDNLLVSMRYGYAIPGGRFFYTTYVEFQTQYDKGYAEVGDENYISNILAPGYLNTSLGMEYKLGKLLSVYLAPASGRTTFVMDPYLSSIGAFGVEPGKDVVFQIGMALTTALEWHFYKNMAIKTDANFFTPYDKDFGNIVVDWNFRLELAVNKFLKATVSTSLKYDDKVTTVDEDGNVRGPRVQFKEMVTVGLGYTFKYKSKQIEF